MTKFKVNPNWSKHRALLHGLRRILTARWVPRPPAGLNEVCAVADREASTGQLVVPGSPASDALHLEARKRGYSNAMTFNDAQTSRWPVVRLYLSALVRG